MKKALDVVDIRTLMRTMRKPKRNRMQNDTIWKMASSKAQEGRLHSYGYVMRRKESQVEGSGAEEGQRGSEGTESVRT